MEACSFRDARVKNEVFKRYGDALLAVVGVSGGASRGLKERPVRADPERTLEQTQPSSSRRL